MCLGIDYFFFWAFLVLCVIWRYILYHICTRRRDEHLFLSRQQILECLHSGRCMSVCAANVLKLLSGHTCVCKVSPTSLLSTAEPCSGCQLQWRPLIYKTCSTGGCLCRIFLWYKIQAGEGSLSVGLQGETPDRTLAGTSSSCPAILFHRWAASWGDL